MRTKYKVIDSDFNKANYPDLIGKTLDNPQPTPKSPLLKKKKL